MARGTFANIRIVNKLLNREVGPKTVHIPTGEKLYMFDAAIGEGDCNAKLGITILGEAVNVEDEVVVINSIVLPNKTLNSCYTKLLCLRRLAYVEFMRKEAAEHALSLDGTSFMSRILKILVATPGRLKDHIENTTGFATRLMGVKVMVLDEADHLLDMGFCKDIEKIIVVVPKERQTLLFSATVLRYSKSPASTLLILAYH